MDFFALIRTAIGRRMLIGALRDVDTLPEVESLITLILAFPQAAAYRDALAPGSTGRAYAAPMVLALLTTLHASKDPSADVEALIVMAESFKPKPTKK